MSYTGNKNRNRFVANKKVDMEINQAYIEARREGIDWLNSSRRDFRQGVNILQKSGYKPIAVGKMARIGEKPHTREKLLYEMRQMIKVWYNPNDPRFADVDLDDDAKVGEDGGSEAVPETVAQNILTEAAADLQREEDEQPAYPPQIAKVIHTFAERYKQRSILHRQMKALGETNTTEVMKQRKDLVARIGALSENMKLLAAIRDSYEKKLAVTEEEIDVALAEPVVEEEKPKEDDDDETDISSLSIEELKKAKANAKSKITKAQNMLLYSSESKPKDGTENPLPECPKRVKYEKKIEQQKALVEKIEYRLAELQ